MKNWLKKRAKFFLGLLLYGQFKNLAKENILKSDCIFFFPYYHTGGAERVHLNIIQALKDKKCTVIFTQNSATDNFLAEFKKVATVLELNPILNKKSNLLNKKLLYFLAKAINSSKSVKHIFGCNTSCYYDILPLLSTSKHKIDLIHALAEDDTRSKVLASSAKLIDTRIVINKKARNDLHSIYLNYQINTKYLENITIIPNGISVPSKKKLDIKNKKVDTIRIGYVGRWSEEKRPEIYLQIAKAFKKINPRVEFVMAGTGMRSNITAINEAGVSFLGELTKVEELENLYKSLNFIIICSEYEGFPMVLMEAMPFAVIPVCTNVGGINEHIINNKNGLLIVNNSQDQIIKNFIKVINEVIESKHDLIRIGEAASIYACSQFNITNFNQSYNKIFKP